MAKKERISTPTRLSSSLAEQVRAFCDEWEPAECKQEMLRDLRMLVHEGIEEGLELGWKAASDYVS